MTTTNDALVKELNGEAQVTTVGPQQNVPTHDPLEVAPPPQAPITQQMDSKFSTVSGQGKGYAVTVRGEFWVDSPTDPRKKTLKDYEVTVNIPQLHAALSVIKKHLLLPAIKRKYPGAQGFRTHYIKSADPLSPETPATNNIQFMNRPALVSYIDSNAVPIIHTDDSYVDPVVLRESLTDYILNPTGFPEREAKRQTERAEKAAILALNPELGDDAPEPPAEVKDAINKAERTVEAPEPKPAPENSEIPSAEDAL